MREITYREALREALQEEMRRDERVLLMGEDLGLYGGCFGVTQGLLEEFGEERVRDTPISEAGFTGIAVGAAVTGMRPVVEIMFCDFITIAMDQIVNQAAKMRYMYGGKVKVPLVVRTAIGAGRSSAAQHSQSLHAWFAHIPGLRVVLPSTPYDAKGLLKSAIRDDNPVVFFEDKMSYNTRGPVPDEEYLTPFGVADVKREGEDMTVVALSRMVYPALEAAEALQDVGISIEVIDPRTLSPYDDKTIVESVMKTGRVILVDEGYQSFGVTAEIASRIYEQAFDYLDAPIKRMGAFDVPVPFSPPLEFATIPDGERIVESVHQLLGQYITERDG